MVFVIAMSSRFLAACLQRTTLRLLHDNIIARETVIWVTKGKQKGILGTFAFCVVCTVHLKSVPVHSDPCAMSEGHVLYHRGEASSPLRPRWLNSTMISEELVVL